MRSPLRLRPARLADTAQLIDVWESAVRATHDFLTESDILGYRERLAREYLPQVEVIVAADEHDVAVGFIGLDGPRVEMLFVHDALRGRGTGTRLLDAALARHEVVELDVNEQNPQAIAFYRARGFEVTGRDELDGEGRPFPLLRMRRERR